MRAIFIFMFTANPPRTRNAGARAHGRTGARG